MKAPDRAPFDQEKSKRTPEELEARWQTLMDDLKENPKDPEVLVQVGLLSEELGRKKEAYLYYHRAVVEDSSKSFLLPKLRSLASTPQETEEIQKLSRRPTSFKPALGDVFRYPMRGGGLAVLLLGALFLYVVRLIRHYNMVPYATAGLTALAVGYYSVFYLDVLKSSATGSDDLPHWPDPTEYGSFFWDWLKLALAGVASFFPLLLGTVFLLSGGIARFEGAGMGTVVGVLVAGLGLFLAGLCYLPMALLANGLFGNPFAGFNYPYLLRSIRVAPKEYALCVLLYFGTAIAAGLLEAASLFRGVFFFSALAATFVELYATTLQMRMLGVFYRVNESRLGWFKR